MVILSMPCVLGFNVLKNFEPFGSGSSIMDIEDFTVSNLLLPIGTIVFIIFCTTRYGWGWDNFVKEANEGKGLNVAKWMRGYMTYVLPLIVFVLLVSGLIAYFS